MPFRVRTSLTALCLAIAVFVTVISGADLPAPGLLLPPLWQVVPTLVAHSLRVDETRRDEQTSGLRAFVAPRPPPRSLQLT